MRLEVHTFGCDCAVVNIEFRYCDGTGGGRQSQTWIRTAEPGYAAGMTYKGLLARDGVVPIDADWTQLYAGDEVNWLNAAGNGREAA